MSRHEGVSCDNCMSANFRGLRYKCLVCYDFDLCARCFDSGSTGQQHTPDHQMQCILTRNDFELYYGGEGVSNDNPQAFACPFCSRLGFTDSTLQVHVSTEHAEMSNEVVCPVCAAMPGGEPNHMTQDLAAHLALDHVNAPREVSGSSGGDEGGGTGAPVGRLGRRINQSATRGAAMTRTSRRSNFATSGGLATLSARESIDPIAELLSQLGGIRRGNSSAASQIQHLQQVLQVHGAATGGSGGRTAVPRRAFVTSIETPATTGTSSQPAQQRGGDTLVPSAAVTHASARDVAAAERDRPRFLVNSLFDCNLSEPERQTADAEQGNRSLFLQEMLLSSMAQEFDPDSYAVRSSSFAQDHPLCDGPPTDDPTTLLDLTQSFSDALNLGGPSSDSVVLRDGSVRDTDQSGGRQIDSASTPGDGSVTGSRDVNMTSSLRDGNMTSSLEPNLNNANPVENRLRSAAVTANFTTSGQARASAAMVSGSHGTGGHVGAQRIVTAPPVTVSRSLRVDEMAAAQRRQQSGANFNPQGANFNPQAAPVEYPAVVLGPMPIDRQHAAAGRRGASPSQPGLRGRPPVPPQHSGRE